MCEKTNSLFERLCKMVVRDDFTFLRPADEVTVMSMDDIELPAAIYYRDFTWLDDTSEKN